MNNDLLNPQQTAAALLEPSFTFYIDKMNEIRSRALRQHCVLFLPPQDELRWKIAEFEAKIRLSGGEVPCPGGGGVGAGSPRGRHTRPGPAAARLQRLSHLSTVAGWTLLLWCWDSTRLQPD